MVGHCVLQLLYKTLDVNYLSALYFYRMIYYLIFHSFWCVDFPSYYGQLVIARHGHGIFVNVYECARC
jgi:hypothetical protein